MTELRHQPQSSNIEGIGYDEAKQELHVKFRGKNDATYVYRDVPSAVHDALTSAPSAGSYFANNIRNKYMFRKTK